MKALRTNMTQQTHSYNVGKGFTFLLTCTRRLRSGENGERPSLFYPSIIAQYSALVKGFYKVFPLFFVSLRDKGVDIFKHAFSCGGAHIKACYVL